MPAKQLCLGCGIRADEEFCPLVAGERTNIFNAANSRTLLNDQRLPCLKKNYLQTTLGLLGESEVQSYRHGGVSHVGNASSSPLYPGSSALMDIL